MEKKIIDCEWQIDLCHGIAIITKEEGDDRDVCYLHKNMLNKEYGKIADHVINLHNESLRNNKVNK